MIPQVLGTKASEADRWATLPERGTPTSLRVIAWIAAHIGRWGARLLLYPITLYFVITARSARRTSYEYLKRLRGESARWWHVFRHFHCFAATILDRVYLLRGVTRLGSNAAKCSAKGIDGHAAQPKHHALL